MQLEQGGDGADGSLDGLDRARDDRLVGQRLHEALEAEAGGKLEVRVLLRDDNVDVMDLFLTNGGRSIPKTVLLDADMNVLGTWGPRPEEAMALVRRIKADPAIAYTYSQEVHKWYTADKQQNIQAELAVLLGHAQGA